MGRPRCGSAHTLRGSADSLLSLRGRARRRGLESTRGRLFGGDSHHSVDHAVAAIEIVDSRVAGWDIGITDTIADNGSSGLFVLGDQRVPLGEFEPVDVTMQMFADDELVSEGNGAACLGDPLNALLWLARTAQQVGDPLRAGQVVLSGALGPMRPVVPGTTVRAEISSLGSVAVTFGPARS